MPTWKENYADLSLKANPTKNFFILKSFVLVLAEFCDFCLLTESCLKSPNPDAPPWKSRACSSRLPSSMDHQPSSLEPWCKKPKKSRALAENAKYLPVPAPVRSKRIIFSTNLDIAKRSATPCNRKRGEKRTGRGIYLAPIGVS